MSRLLYLITRAPTHQALGVTVPNLRRTPNRETDPPRDVWLDPSPRPSPQGNSEPPKVYKTGDRFCSLYIKITIGIDIDFGFKMFRRI